MWDVLVLVSILIQVQYGMCFTFQPLSQKITQQRISTTLAPTPTSRTSLSTTPLSVLFGWVQFPESEEWVWQEDDPSYVVVPSSRQKQQRQPQQQVKLSHERGERGPQQDFVGQGRGVTTLTKKASATPQLPSGAFKPKQSLGQNFLKDPNTVAKILRTFHQDATIQGGDVLTKIVELGPGAGALTGKLVETYGVDALHCIEIDERAIDLLREKYPALDVKHADVLQVDYAQMANELQNGEPLAIVGNLPYYITSQILFALADASHVNAVRCATVTMQWEVGQRIVAKTSTKDYGILSVVFQLYTAHVQCHFKIPPTVFYPKPKVDSALIGLHFLGPRRLERRLGGVQPVHLRRVLTACFQQRRKTVRNSLKKLVNGQIHPGNPAAVEALLNGPPLPLPASIRAARDDEDSRDDKDQQQDAKFFATQELPADWASKRPEELTPGQFVELTRLLYGPADGVVIANGDDSSSAAKRLGAKVWRKLKHGANNTS
jgi:16S rRNA (adenine1518-N6/adenine1519-N6)-dimethyltransferase